MKKEKTLFEKVKDNFELIDCSIEDCIKYTYTLTKSTPVSRQREEFWEDYKKQDFDFIINKYALDGYNS